MKITNLRVTTVTVPLEAPLRHASGAHWGRFVRTIIELEPSDAQVLIAALEDSRWAPRGLSKALSSRGVNLAPDTIQNHMKKMCRCSKI